LRVRETSPARVRPLAAAGPAASTTPPAADSYDPRPGVPTEGVPERWPALVPGPVRGFLVRVGAAAAWLGDRLAGLFGREPAGRGAHSPAGRAQAAWRAADAALAIPGRGLYLERAGEPLAPATVWPHGQAIAAALDLAALTGDYRQVDDLMAGLSFYKRDGAYSGGIDELRGAGRYYDDNAWIALDFLQAHAQTGQHAYLEKAEELFRFLEAGQHRDGGMYWLEKADRMTRNTCATAPAIQVALRLYLATRDERYLAFAKRQDAFLDARLRSPEGLYWDNLGDDGAVDRAIHSYNQGTPIGSDVLFYRITGDKRYLERARATADAALAHFGQDDRLWKSSPAFNAIFFRNLLALDLLAPDPRYRAAMTAYLDRAWREARDPATGLFSGGGIGAYGKPGNLLDQAGFAQMYALLGWPPERLLDVS